MANKTDTGVYAAGQAREYLRSALEGKENTWIYEYAGYVDDSETLDLLNYLCSIWNPRDPSQPEEFLETELAETIVRSAATRTADAAFHEGEATTLQGIVGLVNNQGDAADALTEIVTRLADEGTIAVITGPPGAGKTATLLDVMRAWGAYTGGLLVGNVGWEGLDEQVSTDIEMLEAMAAEKCQALAGIDEANQGSLTGRGADAKKAETWANRMTMIRKDESEHGPHAKRGSAILVSHNWGRLNAPTRRMTTLVIQKPSRQDPTKAVLWESPGGEDKREKVGQFGGLTDTRENYSEHEASAFDVELDDGDDDSETVDEDAVERRKAIETAIRACKPWSDDDGVSYTQAAGFVGYSNSWVGDRVREWQDGQYRELVADSTGESD